MMDFTEVIGRLSEVFQADDLLMMEVIPSVESAMLTLVEMKASPGSNVSSLSTGDMYCGISPSGKVQPVLDQIHIGLLDSALNTLTLGSVPCRLLPSLIFLYSTIGSSHIIERS